MSSLSLTVNLNDLTLSRSILKTKAITTSGPNEDYRVLTITSGAEVTFTIDTDIGDAGLCVIVNQDASNFLKVGFATGDYPIKILAGCPAVIPLAAATSALYLRADTADLTAEIYVHEA